VFRKPAEPTSLYTERFRAQTPAWRAATANDLLTAAACGPKSHWSAATAGRLLLMFRQRLRCRGGGRGRRRRTPFRHHRRLRPDRHRRSGLRVWGGDAKVGEGNNLDNRITGGTIGESLYGPRARRSAQRWRRRRSWSSDGATANDWHHRDSRQRHRRRRGRHTTSSPATTDNDSVSAASATTRSRGRARLRHALGRGRRRTCSPTARATSPPARRQLVDFNRIVGDKISLTAIDAHSQAGGRPGVRLQFGDVGLPPMSPVTLATRLSAVRTFLFTGRHQRATGCGLQARSRGALVTFTSADFML
jgi:hypothetical protein